jgi:hypothetical protein
MLSPLAESRGSKIYKSNIRHSPFIICVRGIHLGGAAIRSSNF